MKQRHHRKAVQRRMREAPTQYDRDCAFYGGHVWSKRDRAKIGTRQPPLLFNLTPKADPETMAAAEAFYASAMREQQELKALINDVAGIPPVFDNTADAMLHALTRGEAWLKVKAP